MGAYEMLAGCYDRLTNDVDYEAIAAFYRTLLRREGVRPRTAVDLACGTGSVTAILAREGLRVIGVDMSEEMLTQAAAKTAGLEPMPVFVRQKLQKLNLPRGVDLAVCALDSLDYITDPKDCAEAIRRVCRALNPGGMFIFDVNTPQKLRAMDGQVFLDEDEDVYCVWRGEFDEETNICFTIKKARRLRIFLRQSVQENSRWSLWKPKSLRKHAVISTGLTTRILRICSAPLRHRQSRPRLYAC